MEPLIIESTQNAKLKSILWGITLIIFGIALEVGMIILFLTENFPVIYIFGGLLFALIIWAGVASLHLRKYPNVLVADDKGIHYFVYAGRLGYNKREVLIAWDTITAIEKHSEDESDSDNNEHDALVIQVSDEFDKPSVIELYDMGVCSANVDDVVLKLNELRRLCSIL